MRRSLSKRLRFEVFKRDGFRCMYCGQRPPEVVLVVDHVVPVKEGGGNEADNLVTSCFACNAGKGAVPLDEVQPAFDELAVMEALQEMAERRMILQTQAIALERQRQEIGEAIERVYFWWCEELDPHLASYFEADSVRTWLEMGRPLEELYDALRITRRTWLRVDDMSPKDIWQYFCGVMWAKIKGKHQR